MRTTITSKGQITIPARLRKRWGLKKGHVIEFDENAPFLQARRVVDEKRARAVLGSMKKELAGKTVDGWMEWLRGPVELAPHAPRRR
ncbi:MAG: AbrB/MazE/SpoVT family DNA-binding domain-containing protein [Opitutus sp.]|nr:AbrB/MazE/SpoVT family DNA-binding domain-containing protein [Opitutus sp.]